MAARRPKSTEHIQLAERIEEWALQHGLFGDHRIVSLTSDLRSQSNWRHWSSLGRDELLPAPNSQAAERLRSIYRTVLFLRNLLVFLPVTVTWIAISESTSSFSEFIADNEGSVVNFLQFWEDGYGYLGSIWRLSTIAFIDFIILLVIMLLTISMQVINARSQRLQVQGSGLIEQEREQLIKELREFFLKSQELTPLTLNQGLANAVRDLNRSSENLERLSKELGKSVKGFPSYVATMREIKALGRAVDKLKKSDE